MDLDLTAGLNKCHSLLLQPEHGSAQHMKGKTFAVGVRLWRSWGAHAVIVITRDHPERRLTYFTLARCPKGSGTDPRWL